MKMSEDRPELIANTAPTVLGSVRRNPLRFQGSLLTQSEEPRPLLEGRDIRNDGQDADEDTSSTDSSKCASED